MTPSTQNNLYADGYCLYYIMYTGPDMVENILLKLYNTLVLHNSFKKNILRWFFVKYLSNDYKRDSVLFRNGTLAESNFEKIKSDD